MSINQRAKGSKGENLAVKVIKTWTSKEFSRVPRSGGLAWNSSNGVGDITCTTEGHYCPFVFEVKTYAKINFDHILYKDKGDIIDFWNQVNRDSRKINKVPMLMMRYNGLPKTFFFIGIPIDFYTKFLADYTNTKDRMCYISHLGLVIMGSTTLLDKVPYKKIRKPIKKYLKSLQNAA